MGGRLFVCYIIYVYIYIYIYIYMYCLLHIAHLPSKVTTSLSKVTNTLRIVDFAKQFACLCTGSWFYDYELRALMSLVDSKTKLVCSCPLVGGSSDSLGDFR